MSKSLKEIGEEIRRHREDRVHDIKGKMMKKYNLTEKQYEEAEEYSY